MLTMKNKKKLVNKKTIKLKKSIDSLCIIAKLPQNEPETKVSPVKKNKIIYFTTDTEAAIIQFNAEKRIKIRNKIYNERIKHAFEKIAENVLNTFKFSYFEVTSLDVQKEVVSYLVSNIHKFDPNKNKNINNGNKAFSYFSVVAKNFLILYNNTNYSNWKKHTIIDQTTMERNEFKIDPDNIIRKEQAREFIQLLVKYCEDNLNTLFKKERDRLIADSILELFRRFSSIEQFNKKALYLYIRDMSNCKTQHITKVINKLKVVHKILEQQYRDYGYIK